MIIYCVTGQQIVPHSGGAIPENAIWIDLHNPTREEELAVETFLGMEIPTREEMHEIEVSNRLYQENNAQFMTATLVTRMDSAEPETHAITFIVAGNVLVTIRYADPLPFRTFAAQLSRLAPEEHNGVTLLLGLLDAIVNRIADVLEFIGRDIDSITKRIFRRPDADKKAPPVNFQLVLGEIGRAGDLASKAHESLATLNRLAAFAAHNKKMTDVENDRALVALRKDIAGLSDHAIYLTGKINFLLDATLGMISIEQNGTIKIFSVASVVFLPPTLLASIYGMNFKTMPELDWHWGYPMAIGLMVLSAVLPYAYFKQKKWL